MNEVKNIRIGNDISIEWTITRDKRPEKFEGKKLIVKLLSYQGEEQKIDYSIEDNRVIIFFYGKDQKTLGLYTLLLIENDKELGMSTLDQVDSFRLVKHSYQEEGQTACTQLKIQNVALDSSFKIGHVIFVIDNLASFSSKDALSANMGRELDFKINQTNKKIPLKVSDLRNDAGYVEKPYVDENVRLLYADLQRVRDSINELIGGDVSEAIDNFNEIEKFLQGFTDKESLVSILADYVKKSKGLNELVIVTQEEYDQLPTKEETTLYIIKNTENTL